MSGAYALYWSPPTETFMSVYDKFEIYLQAKIYAEIFGHNLTYTKMSVGIKFYLWLPPLCRTTSAVGYWSPRTVR